MYFHLVFLESVFFVLLYSATRHLAANFCSNLWRSNEMPYQISYQVVQVWRHYDSKHKELDQTMVRYRAAAAVRRAILSLLKLKVAQKRHAHLAVTPPAPGCHRRRQARSVGCFQTSRSAISEVAWNCRHCTRANALISKVKDPCWLVWAILYGAQSTVVSLRLRLS